MTIHSLPIEPSRNHAPPSQRRLHIAFFVDGTSTMSGVDTSARLLAAGLRQHGHEVVFFIPRIRKGDHGQPSHLSTQHSAQIIRLPALRVHKQPDVYWSNPLSRKLITGLWRERFDVIHMHNATAAYVLVRRLSRLIDVPLVYTYHTMMAEYAHYLGAVGRWISPLIPRIARSFDRLTCNAADWVTTPSHKAKAYLDQIGIFTPIEVIPNGIDLAQFTPQPSRYLVERLGLRPEQRVLLFVGRLNHEKRPVEAYAAFRELHQRTDQAVLVMAGEGVLAVQIRRQAQEDGLAHCVHLLGQVPHGDMASLYNAAHIWISSSTSEVHPMVALEAAACGLPAVVVQDRALEGVVVDRTTGFIVQSADQMVDSLYNLLNDAALHERMRVAAAQQARQFDVDTVSRRFVELYRRLIARRAGSQREPSSGPARAA